MTSNDNTKLKGLVLAGGKSKRMGHDKTIISWHGKEQRYYMADMLAEVCEEVYISCRAEQEGEIDTHYKALPDSYEGLGPYGGILSAFAKEDDCAWLVIASDLPLMDKDTLDYLISQRDPSVIATSFESPHDGLPEPLVAIWEPASRNVLLSFMAEDYTCPRKVLIRNAEQVKLVKPLNPDALINANTPEDAAKVEAILGHKTMNN